MGKKRRRDPCLPLHQQENCFSPAPLPVESENPRLAVVMSPMISGANGRSITPKAPRLKLSGLVTAVLADITAKDKKVKEL